MRVLQYGYFAIASTRMPATEMAAWVGIEPDEVGGRADRIGGLTKLPGQHQLLGWHLDARTLDFPRATRAELGVDEYDGSGTGEHP